ncbi:hypothetical protein BpHYR1_012832 [Brachionus plicatilis]|uniref:Uncharacterized protein n=1 Tax=Brachionus plicatilis TaxID=10195 RepID=A0A3M7RIZ0_BRAPC|nr:hypothetical protein BpHYR1_012832 [Brachionus plicatilis]
MQAEYYFKKALRRYRDGEEGKAKFYFKKAFSCSDAGQHGDEWKDLVHEYGLSSSEIKRFIDININIENLGIKCSIQ